MHLHRELGAPQGRSHFSGVLKDALMYIPQAAGQGLAWGEGGAMFDVPVRIYLVPPCALDKIKGRE